MDIIYYVALSMDGYIATPDGKVNWLDPFQPATGEDYGYGAFFESVDALVMGSNSYEQVLGFGDWPYGNKPTWVCSSRPVDVTVPSIQGTNATPNELVAQLRSSGFKKVWLVGGTQLASSFYKEKLITQFQLYYMPVFLGSGKPLLDGTDIHQSLSIRELTQFSNDVVGIHLDQKEPLDQQNPL